MALPEYVERRLDLFKQLTDRRARLEFLERTAGDNAPTDALWAEDFRAMRDEFAQLADDFARIGAGLSSSLPWHERRAHAAYVDGLRERARLARSNAQNALLSYERPRWDLARSAARVADRLGEMTQRQAALQRAAGE